MRDYWLVDVFGTRTFSGNPLPVIADCDTLEPDEMQRITRWFGYSESAFLQSPTEPGADYRVRIFTLDRELPFAGHPTLGACHAWLAGGGQPQNPERIVQQCGAGLIPIRRSDDQLRFAAPPLVRSGPVDDSDLIDLASFLSIGTDRIVDSQWVDNGPGWVGILLPSAQEVLALDPPARWPRRLELGVVGPHPLGADHAYEVRAFFSDQRGTIHEDPITGSLNASLAQWLTASGRFTPPYAACQGTALGREGWIGVTRDDEGQIWIGGSTLTIAEGRVAI